MSNVHREFLTLDQVALAVHLEMPSHVSYDPGVEQQYFLRRGARHDGTRIFTIELLGRALLELANGTTYYKPMGAPSTARQIRYTIGRIRFISCEQMVDLPCGRQPGLRERVVIPVRCEWVN